MDPFREVDAGALERVARLEDENEELRRRVAALEDERAKRAIAARGGEDLQRELEEARTEAVTERMRRVDLERQRSIAVSPGKAFGAGIVMGLVLGMIVRH